MKNLAIIGSGDLGQLIAYHSTTSYTVVGYIDDFAEKDSFVENLPILGTVNDIEELYQNSIFDELIIAIGYKHFDLRARLYNQFSKNIPFATIIHPSSVIDSSCKIGSGVFVLPGVVVDRKVVIQDNVLLNVGVTIAHDSFIGKHSFISPSVAIAGFVNIGEKCNIGINTTVIDNVTITSNVQTGGGTVVINDLTLAGLYVGNPSRFIK
ncbi:NeuD/PglB/VioB family sugar acetyltransferase [Patiriisocius hiemis]|uniref:NeuD/PglB/VioB family sugar acetyltransferase n=1 Tax=Patiriisocius hiemis TaxID=3075604 RepID=A0ABU2YEH3_9FLAO|nr:NeuD/PglB/VioB family sugar acetyltransferase [Constantimarinum sp. W242]MDT0556049.1 NeuD/PglB/VioB family sugar acetyltransferase [Constantimarinum sp. W242]